MSKGQTAFAGNSTAVMLTATVHVTQVKDKISDNHRTTRAAKNNRFMSITIKSRNCRVSISGHVMDDLR